MQKINVIEYLPKIMTELEKGILVNTKNDNKLNTMTIAWGQIGIEWNKFVFTTYIRHTRFTHEQIEGSKEFTVSIPMERTPQIAKAMGFCGYRNGKDIDKFKEYNLTAVEGVEVNSPAIKEIPLTLECKVIYKQEQEHNNIPNELYEKFYKNVPSSDGTKTNDDYHTVYYGEIVNAYIVE